MKKKKQAALAFLSGHTSLLRYAVFGTIATGVLLLLTLAAARVTTVVLGDVPLYKHYAQAISHGNLPYHHLKLEYPPGFLLFILLAIPVAWLFGSYVIGYVCLTGLAVSGLLAHRYKLDGTRGLILAAALLVPLLQFVFYDLDIFSAIILYSAVYAMQRHNYSVSAGLLALSLLVKGYPGVCLLGLFWLVPATHRRRYIAIFGGIIAAAIVPLTVWAPRGVWYALTYHTGRPTEAEATGSTVGFWLHLVGNRAQTLYTHGSWALVYPGEKIVNLLSTLLLAASLIALSTLVWRGWLAAKPATLSLLFLVTYIFFFKVGSPQYFVTVLVLVPLTRSELRADTYRRLLGLCFATAVMIWTLFVTFFDKGGLALTSYTFILAVLTLVRAGMLAGLAIYLMGILRHEAQRSNNLAAKGA